MNEEMIPKKVCASESLGHIAEKLTLIKANLIGSVLGFGFAAFNLKIVGALIIGALAIYDSFIMWKNMNYQKYLKEKYDL